MASRRVNEIVGALSFAAKDRIVVSGQSPWNYGWGVEEYRASGRALIEHNAATAVRFGDDGLRAFEAAVRQLLSMDKVTTRWEVEEFWGVVASLVGTLPLNVSDPHDLVAGCVELLLSADTTNVLFEVANVEWSGNPIRLAEVLVVGRGDSKFDTAFRRLRHSMMTPISGKDGYFPDATNDDVFFGAVVNSMGMKAKADAESLFNTLVDVCLLFTMDPSSHELWSLRGDFTRPGVRGLKMHRQSLSASSDARVKRELAARIALSSILGKSSTFNWFDSTPFPLWKLLAPPTLRKRILRRISSSGELSRRVQVAAAWHARAHWSLSVDEAILSLGIAFDALLGEDSGPQRRELAERFALLRPKAERQDAYALFSETYYTARSTVAHGRSWKAEGAVELVRKMSGDLRRTALLVEQLAVRHNISTNAEYSRYFHGIKWSA